VNLLPQVAVAQQLLEILLFLSWSVRGHGTLDCPPYTQVLQTGEVVKENVLLWDDADIAALRPAMPSVTVRKDDIA
jgi:hypothetical protein